MGNTPSKGNMNSKRKRGRPGPSSQKLTLSPQPVERKKSKKDSSRDDDDEIVILDSKKISNKSKRRSETVSAPSSSSGRLSAPSSSSGRLSAPSSSSGRLSTGSASVVKPMTLKIKALSGVSSRPKRDQPPGSKNSDRRSKTCKKPELASLIATKSGPRAEVNDDGCYKVGGIVKKWVGKSDQSDQDEFYLVHWFGRPVPKANNNDDWLHRSQLKDCDEMIKKADEEYEIALEERKRKVKNKSKFYEIVSDDSDDERKKKPDQEVTGIETSSGKVLRRRENINFSEDSKSVRNGGKRSHSTGRQEPVGFDRGLGLEKVAAVVTYNGRLAYLLKFEGSNKCDLVPSSVCRQRIPNDLIDFYDKNTRTSSVFEQLDESDLASDALKVFKRAVELGKIHDK